MPQSSQVSLALREKGSAWSGTLDRVVYYPGNGLEPTMIKVILKPLFDDISENDLKNEQLVKEYIVRHLEDGPAFASDHQPIIAQFKLSME